MYTLYIEYLSYICQVSLTVNKQLVNLYNQYSDHFSKIESNLDYNFNDYELTNFLIHLIDSAEYWSSTEIARCIDDMVLSYYRLSDLIRYMHNINYIMLKHKTFLEESFLHYSQLDNCQLEDSRLVSLQVDNKKHLCNIILDNVLLYSEKRINKSLPVDCGLLILSFLNTKKVELKGEICVECHEVNRVYKWHLMETSEKLKCFCLLILIGNRCFILQITCTDIQIEAK